MTSPFKNNLVVVVQKIIRFTIINVFNLLTQLLHVCIQTANFILPVIQYIHAF